MLETAALVFDIPPSVQVISIDERYADDLYELVQRNREHLQIYLPRVVTEISSPEAALRHIQYSQQLALAGEILEFHILYEGGVCGAVRLNNFEPENRKVSIAYFLGKEFEGRGIVTRACQAVIRYGFDTMELNRIELRCATSNSGSMAVAKRLGFSLEGELRQAELLEQGFVNHFVYGLLQEDYAKFSTA